MQSHNKSPKFQHSKHLQIKRSITFRKKTSANNVSQLNIREKIQESQNYQTKTLPTNQTKTI